MGNCQWLMEGTCYGRFLERKRSRWLLTHHQPCGWSPALEKGGYTLGLTPIAFVGHQYETCVP